MGLLESPSNRREAGFAMVALLVGMSVAAIWMTAALPAWRQQTLRQKEEDLIFRGEQYARAIVLFQSRNRNALPPSVDVLVSGRYLRKKWKDPITNEDFILMGSGIQSSGTPQASAPQQAPGRGATPGTSPQQGQPGQGQQQQAPGITGVRSRSMATSIKIYQNQQVYSAWPFDAALIRARMGRAFQNPGGQPGGQPGRQGTPGDRGGQPGRGGQEMGPIQPGRGGLDRPGGPGSGGAPPPPGRGGGSFF